MERFEAWVRFVFDHPVSKPEWYWNADDALEYWTSEPALNVGWMTQLFR